MGLFADLKMYGRFATGLRGFLNHTIDLEEARGLLLKGIAERENNFLRLLEYGVFGNPKSPYLRLLELAKCEFEDIRGMVQVGGIEDTLSTLHDAGVYVTFEEYKGREPIIRDGQEIEVQPRDFDNPYLRSYYQAKTGGSTGAGTRVMIDLEHIAAFAPHMMLAQHAYGVMNAPTASWHGIPPDESGLRSILSRVRWGNVPEKWFSPFTNEELKPDLKSRMVIRYIIGVGRMFGVPLPWPEPVGLDKAILIARWAHGTVTAKGSCVVTTHVSKALRVCIAAQEEGLDLTGVTFIVGGEPPTLTKVREITRSGARVFPGYFFAEVGTIGMGCGNPSGVNDVHLFKDALAITQHPRQVPGSDLMVDAFSLTTLLPTAPKLLLNVESDDYGVLETRVCGCPLEELGYTQHVQDIRSYSKLTGEGMTLVGSEMLSILEDVLPTKFGGTPLDYQLLEEEDDRGFTRLSVIVSPRIDLQDESAVVETVLDAMGKTSVSADIARATWSKAGTLRVKRMEPVIPASGKFMPLYTVRQDDMSSTTADHS